MQQGDTMTSVQHEEGKLEFKREMLGVAVIPGLPNKGRILAFLQGQPSGSCPMYCVKCGALGAIHSENLKEMWDEGFPVDPSIVTVQLDGCPACTDEFGGRFSFREVAKLSQ